MMYTVYDSTFVRPCLLLLFSLEAILHNASYIVTKNHSVKDLQAYLESVRMRRFHIL